MVVEEEEEGREGGREGRELLSFEAAAIDLKCERRANNQYSNIKEEML